MAELGGAEVAGGTKASGYGCGGGEVGQGGVRRGEVERPVAIIGEVVVRMGEEMVVTGTETGSEVRGGDGAAGSTGCALSPPTTPWSAALLEISEAVVEAAVFLVAPRRAFFAARSASLELRARAGCRLRAAGAGMSASTSSRLIGIGSLRRKRRDKLA